MQRLKTAVAGTNIHDVASQEMEVGAGAPKAEKMTTTISMLCSCLVEQAILMLKLLLLASNPIG